MFCANLGAPPAPHGACQHRRDILRQAHRFAHLANRHARAIMDHCGAEPGALAAKAAIDILDHLLAALVLEIDIDIGRLFTLFRNETIK